MAISDWWRDPRGIGALQRIAEDVKAKTQETEGVITWVGLDLKTVELLKSLEPEFGASSIEEVLAKCIVLSKMLIDELPTRSTGNGELYLNPVENTKDVGDETIIIQLAGKAHG